MDYFKEWVGVEQITKEHYGVVNSVTLDKTISEYIEMGYTEFKVEYVRTVSVEPHKGREFKLTARGDKDKIIKKVRAWYPDLLDE